MHQETENKKSPIRMHNRHNADAIYSTNFIHREVSSIFPKAFRARGEKLSAYRQNYVRCRKNYIRHNSNYIGHNFRKISSLVFLLHKAVAHNRIPITQNTWKMPRGGIAPSRKAIVQNFTAKNSFLYSLPHCGTTSRS